MKKEKVVFVYPKKASFISIEKQILEEKYEVLENTYDWTKKKLVPLYMLHQLFWCLLMIPKSKSVLVSFAGYWSLFPVLIAKFLGKPSYVVVHGMDGASFREIGYGVLQMPFIKSCCEKTFLNATKILPVSESLVYTENTYFDQHKVVKQGYQHFFPQVKTNHEVIFNGIEIDKWEKITNIQKQENTFVTVLGEGQFLRKGGELIITIAKLFPQYEFYFVGMNQPSTLEKLNNVHFVGRKTPQELKEIYSCSNFYLQLSIFEGFGCALCEAMLCECIPIGANVNMIPQIIGESGYILQHQDEQEAKELFSNLQYQTDLGQKARTQIINNFSIEHRAQKLLKIV